MSGGVAFTVMDAKIKAELFKSAFPSGSLGTRKQCITEWKFGNELR